MTGTFTRRRAIQLLTVGALAGSVLPLSPARAVGASRFAPPHAPMLFKSRIRHDLGDNVALITQRTFEVRFIPVSEGYRLEGTQVAAEIDAPEDLAPLAEIWRKTPLTTLFPFSVDENGLVIPNSGPNPAAVPDLSEAIDVALDMLRKGGSSETVVDDAHSFFLWLQKAANEIGSDIPRDLMVPPAKLQQASKLIELPGGTSGTIEISFLGTTWPDTGVMREAERHIVTRVEGTSQRSSDNWSLALA